MRNTSDALRHSLSHFRLAISHCDFCDVLRPLRLSISHCDIRYLTATFDISAYISPSPPFNVSHVFLPCPFSLSHLTLLPPFTFPLQTHPCLLSMVLLATEIWYIVRYGRFHTSASLSRVTAEVSSLQFRLSCFISLYLTT